MKPERRLRLRRETLAPLDGEELRDVRGQEAVSLQCTPVVRTLPPRDCLSRIFRECPLAG